MSMGTHKSLFAFVILSCALFLKAQSLHAQGEPQAPLEDKPKPAGASANPIPLVNLGDQQDQENQPSSGMTPDTTPLTGVQEPTVGYPEVRHSYWQTGLQWSGSIQSNPYNLTPGSSWLMNDFFAGTLSLLKASSRSQLALNYSGGGFVSTDSSQGNGYYHQLAASQTFQWKRLTLQLLDQFSYLPQSSFGFGVGTGLGFPGTGGSLGPIIPGLGNNFVPNQGIYSAIGARYSNASSVQVTYTTSPRGSITLSGTYGLLNFVESGNINNQTTTGTIGYNYTLTREDSIGVFYRFSAFHFTGQPEAYGDHSANVGYSRKLTGRMALRLYGGPDITVGRTTISGSSTTHGVNAGASLSYAFKKGGFSLSYNHSVYGGSGVLTGSLGDNVNFGANRQLSRVWSGQLNVGYSRNAPIQSAPLTISQSFNTWNVGGSVSRPLGRSASLAIAYNTILTDYGLAGCVGAACSSSQMYQYVTVNFSWHTRPFVLP